MGSDGSFIRHPPPALCSDPPFQGRHLPLLLELKSRDVATAVEVKTSDAAAVLEGRHLPLLLELKSHDAAAAVEVKTSNAAAAVEILTLFSWLAQGRHLPLLLELKSRDAAAAVEGPDLCCKDQIGATWTRSLLGGAARRSCWKDMHCTTLRLSSCDPQRNNELLGGLLGGAAGRSCWEDLHCTTLQLSSYDSQKNNDSAAQWGLPGCLDQEGAELWLRRGQGLMGPWSGKHETDMQLRCPTLGRVWGAEFGYPFQWCCDEQPGRNALEPDGVQTAGRRAVHWREVQASRAFWAPGWPGSITAGMGYELFKSVSHRGGCGGLER
ncbi:unnamed protein product [Closterium sp. Yama58-4]|nr:unnamed protein product [Closterium sp. Yama58-4]